MEHSLGTAPPPTHAAPAGAPPYALVAMAASAGGLAVLRCILAALPVDFPIPIVIVQHRSSAAPERLPALLGRVTPLRVKMAETGETMHPGTVYVSPPEGHLVVAADGSLRVTDGRRIRFLRSSAEPLFESAALALEGRVIAVVLTGGGANGTHGVIAVHARGGAVIAQDPDTADHPSMPRSAIATGAVDEVLPPAAIAPALLRLALAGRVRPVRLALPSDPA